MNKKIVYLIIFMVFSLIFITYKNKREIIILQNINKIEEKIKEKESEEPTRSNISLIAAGDIMVHSPQFRAAYNYEKDIYEFESVFKYVKKYIQEADIALVNLETVIAGENIGFSGFPKFNTPKEILKAIEQAGFNIISTANNHSLDYGEAGLINTINAIEEYGLKNIGTYKEKNKKILVEEVKGIKIGLLSYTYGLNLGEDSISKEEVISMVNLIDEEKIKKDIDTTKKLGADLTLIFIHWGKEYGREPLSYQIELGEKIIAWGGDIILGSHPHVIQRAEIIKKDGKNKFIIYSMGNFLSNQRANKLQNSYSEDGVLVKLNIEKNYNSGETLIKNIEYIPTWVHKYREKDKLFYEILPLKDVLNKKIKSVSTEKLENRLKESYKNTLEVLGQYKKL